MAELFNQYHLDVYRKHSAILHLIHKTNVPPTPEDIAIHCAANDQLLHIITRVQYDIELTLPYLSCGVDGLSWGQSLLHPCLLLGDEQLLLVGVLLLDETHKFLQQRTQNMQQHAQHGQQSTQHGQQRIKKTCATTYTHKRTTYTKYATTYTKGAKMYTKCATTYIKCAMTYTKCAIIT